MRTREELRGAHPSSDGQETVWAKKGAGISKKRGEEDWQALPSVAPVFIKLQGSINAMYSETSIDLSFLTLLNNPEK